MSAFLGPIHYWVFNKIKFQNKIVDELINYAANKNLDIAALLNKKYKKLEDAPLEDIIDGSNIHGWLQQRVSLVEYRLAEAVKIILDSKIAGEDDLQKLFYRFAKKEGMSIIKAKISSAIQAYKMLNDLLLDGMPCDGANELLSESDNQVSWRTAFCVHGAYWRETGIDISIYYLLRESLIAGLLSDTDYEFVKSAEEYAVKKRC